MKKVSNWYQSAALLSLFAIATTSLPSSVIAQSTTVTSNINQNTSSNTSQIAQAMPNLCRKITAKQGVVIREKPSLASRQIGILVFNSQVNLVEATNALQDSEGRLWVEIASPVTGYISNGFANSESNLGMCTASPMPQPIKPPDNNGNNRDNNNPNLCRQVEPRVAPRGLAVRAEPSAGSTYRGGVPARSKVTLVPNYKLILDKSGQNRNWVEITSPVAGFVSAQSLIMCR
ncbi:hypothetical protein BCD67_18275 [Oscillatoriales cyanobacterium USR001]|nr:hypothetical protein BCD67_18275 [Oscillatoriales cyanobacterium USR001]